MYTIICDPDVCTNLHFLLWKHFIFVCRGTNRFLDRRNIIIMIKMIKVDMKKYFNVQITSGVITTPSYCLHVRKNCDTMTTDETAFVHQCKCCVVVCKVRPGKQNLCLLIFFFSSFRVKVTSQIKGKTSHTRFQRTVHH